MAETAYCHCTIVNETKYNFVVKNKELDWGKWGDDEKDEPVTCNRSKVSGGSESTLAFKACGHEGSTSGAEGWVEYNLVDPKDKGVKGSFKLNFSAPYSGGTNYVHFSNTDDMVDGPDDRDASHQGLGFTERLTIKMPPQPW